MSEQAASLETLRERLTEVDGLPQQTAAIAEETAATSRELTRSAKDLRDLTRRFRLTEGRARRVA